MAPLFRKVLQRSAAARTRRLSHNSFAIAPERLEQRIALAADTISRPPLVPATGLYVDASRIGPTPIVFSKSEIVGNDVKSFVIASVANGVVEKFDFASNTWRDVSTKPTSGNPSELMSLLTGRVIRQGDQMRWRPAVGDNSATRKAFEIIGWDDGSSFVPPAPDAVPSAVRDVAVVPNGAGELTVSWNAPETGSVANYTVRTTITEVAFPLSGSEIGPNSETTGALISTSNRSLIVANVPPPRHDTISVITVSVIASNSEGASSDAIESVWVSAPIAQMATWAEQVVDVTAQTTTVEDVVIGASNTAWWLSGLPTGTVSEWLPAALLTVRRELFNQSPTVEPVQRWSDGQLIGHLRPFDAEGEELSFTVLVHPENGTLELDESGGYTYTPNPTTQGGELTASVAPADSFVLGVSDPAGGRNLLDPAASGTTTVPLGLANLFGDDVGPDGSVPAGDLTGKDLAGANLAGVNLAGATLTGSDLTLANLNSADLTGADVSGANLTKASLNGTNLTAVGGLAAANLTNANLSGVVIQPFPSILELQAAYRNRTTTVQGVVNTYLNRIQIYNVGLNAVGQISPDLAGQIFLVQDLINGGATPAQFPLLGVPVLVKDSYDVQGMYTTNGASILNLAGPDAAVFPPPLAGATGFIAKADAAAVATLRRAGAIILGKTNMATWAGSTTNGWDNAHGAVYNAYVGPGNILLAAGGSSSGSGVATAANFAMFTMGGETGGSIRTPSTLNGVVGLKTSTGLIASAGTWPLVTAQDVLGPIGRSVTDVAITMNALVRPSDVTTNAWVGSAYYPLGGPQPGAIGTGLGEGSDPTSFGLTVSTGTRPADYTAFLSSTALVGKKFVIPSSIVREGDLANEGKAFDGFIQGEVYDNFMQQVAILRAQGAEVVTMDIPAEQIWLSTPKPNDAWKGATTAFYLQQQIDRYGNPVIQNVAQLATALSSGFQAGSGFLGFPPLNDASLKNAGSVTNDILSAQQSPQLPITSSLDAIQGLTAMTRLRESLERWMTDNGVAALIAPTLGETNPFYLIDKRTGYDYVVERFEVDILGQPAVTVPSGMISVPGIPSSGLWTGIQFIGRLAGEAPLLGFAYDYEQATQYSRLSPPDLAFFTTPKPGTPGMPAITG